MSHKEIYNAVLIKVFSFLVIDIGFIDIYVVVFVYNIFAYLFILM